MFRAHASPSISYCSRCYLRCCSYCLAQHLPQISSQTERHRDASRRGSDGRRLPKSRRGAPPRAAPALCHDLAAASRGLCGTGRDGGHEGPRYATRRGVFHLRTFRRGGRFRLGRKLLSVALCPILLRPRLRLNEMSRSLFQKDARTGFQMLRFRSFERQRSLLVTQHIQMDFVRQTGKKSILELKSVPAVLATGPHAGRGEPRVPGHRGLCSNSGPEQPGRVRGGQRGQTAALGTPGALPAA